MDLGEFRKGAAATEFMTAELSGNVAKGDFLAVTGVNADGELKMATHTAAADARAVAIYDGKSGELAQVLLKGIVKANITGGSNFNPGASYKVKANKAVKSDTASSSANVPGFLLCDPDNASGDKGPLYFDGGASA